MAHKGIVCPACGARSGTPYKSGFNYVADIQVLRQCFGFNDEGKLRLECSAYEYTEDENARLICHKCNHEFPIPEDVLDESVWE